MSAKDGASLARLKSLLIAGCVLALVTPAFAQPVPLLPPPGATPPSKFESTATVGPPTSFTPIPRAKPTANPAPAASATIRTTVPATNPPAASPSAKTTSAPAKPTAAPAAKNAGPAAKSGPRLVAPSNGPFVPPQAMNAQQRETLMRISAYFNNLRTLKGDFVQIGPRGEQSEGQFYLSRPGKIRFHYKPPVRVDVISDGRSVAVEDRTAMTQNIYPLSRTPLKHLLAERIDLASDRIVAGYRDEPDVVSLLLAEATFGDGKLTLIFDRTTFELRQWVVTDAQGLDTSIAVYNTEIDQAMDPQLFKIYVTQDLR